MQNDHQTPEQPYRLMTISRLVFFGFVAIAAYFLITEHRAHLFGILPYLLILACPLLHMFHHRHRDGQGGGQ